MKAIKFLVALLLLPALHPLFAGIWKSVRGLDERMLFMENPLNLCFGGLVLWMMFALLFRLPPRIYVFAHELTHALFVRLCGGRVDRISIRKDRGYVLSDRTNFLIVLAPYLFPFYACCLGAVALVVAFFVPISSFRIPVWMGIGFCLGYHWTMTARMLVTRQNDFASQGWFFSFVLVLLVNLFYLLLMFLLLPQPRGFFGHLLAIGASIMDSYRALFDFLCRF